MADASNPLPQSELPEPWMRGPIAGVDPRLAPVLYSFQMAREDLAKYTAGLKPSALWSRPQGIAPVGFHILHIAGSARRLSAYLEGRELTEQELASTDAEPSLAGLPLSAEELLARLERALQDAEAVVKSVDVAKLTEPRTVGRKRLPTTVIGLLTHIAEHTQRHVGQAITTAKLVAEL